MRILRYKIICWLRNSLYSIYANTWANLIKNYIVFFSLFVLYSITYEIVLVVQYLAVHLKKLTTECFLLAKSFFSLSHSLTFSPYSIHSLRMHTDRENCDTTYILYEYIHSRYVHLFIFFSSFANENDITFSWIVVWNFLH